MLLVEVSWYILPGNIRSGPESYYADILGKLCTQMVYSLASYSITFLIVPDSSQAHLSQLIIDLNSLYS
jgi:hypothetical protein